jgi:hypothetical protein
MQLDKGVYTEEDHKYYVRKHLQLLDRNVQEMRAIIGEKYDVHEDMIHQSNSDLDFELLSQE